MNHSTAGLPVHHQIPEFTQTRVHRVGDAIQPSHPVVPFSSCPQSLPASGSFPMSQLFAWGGQSIGVSASASVLPMNTQGWSPLGWTGWISLQSKGLSRVLSKLTEGRGITNSSLLAPTFHVGERKHNSSPFSHAVSLKCWCRCWEAQMEFTVHRYQKRILNHRTTEDSLSRCILSSHYEEPVYCILFYPVHGVCFSTKNYKVLLKDKNHSLKRLNMH